MSSSSSRPHSSADMEPADLPTAPNTPGPSIPLLGSSNEPRDEAQDSAQDTFQRNVHTPLPINLGDSLEPPRASYLDSSPSTPRDSYLQASINDSSHRLAEGPLVLQGDDPDTPVSSSVASKKKRSFFARPVVWLGAAVALVIVVLVVILPVYFTVIKKKHSSASSSASSGGGGAPPAPSPSAPSAPKSAITGGDGSVITMDDGSNFTYSNSFGGSWYYDPEDPFNNNAQANSWTPPLNTSWNFGKDKIQGVNIGGLFVLEPFISPSLYQKYPGAIDEWTLSTLMAADTASGGLNQIEDHYNTFVTEQDIAEIAGAGLNWIRVPIPFWAIETWAGEPFLAKVSWKYIVRLLGWARKYGLRVNLDLHTIPGSQNGFNHSGKDGIVNFLNGVMGVANAQRALNYIRIITEFISQPEWADVVPIFGVMNEPLMKTIGQAQMYSFYLEVHDMIRNITGVGAGKGPYMSVHDGFTGVSGWAGFMPGSDRVILDSHPYFAFTGPSNSPIASGTGSGAGGVWPLQACNAWGNGFNASRNNFGVTVAGEFSAGFNDCGLFLKGVGVSPQTSNCAAWQDSTNWSAATKAGVMAFTLASMDALQDYFFWTWKIGNSTAGLVETPLWSYQLGLTNGWIPTDPRKAVGSCASLGVEGSPFDGTFLPWQTGGAGAGTISASFTQSYGVYPPTSIANADADAAQLPQYTSTAVVATLPPPTLTASATHSIDVGNGWFDASDTAPGVTAIQGCTYPNAWSAVNVAVPTACGANTGAALAAAPTAPPRVRREMN